MPLCKVGSFSIGTGAATTTVAVSGVGFQPKVVIFWWNGRTDVADAAGQQNIHKGFGYAISTTDRRSCSTQSADGQGSAVCDGTERDDACICTLTTGGTADGLADLSSMDSDGFTLVIDNNFASSWTIQYMALAGDDLTDYEGGIFTEAAATGDQDITTVSFQPDCVIFFSTGDAGDPPSAHVDSRMMVGVAAGATPSNAVTTGASNDGATTMQTIYHASDDYCVVAIANDVLSLAARASVTAWLSNGFRLNWAERNSTRRIQFLALKGGNYHVGSITLPISGANQSATGLGFSPTGALLSSGYAAETAGDSVADEDFLMLGAFNSTSSRVALCIHDFDAQLTSVCVSGIDFDKVYIHTLGSGAVGYSADIVSVDSDGFTLSSGEAGAPSAFTWYLAFGLPAGQPMAKRWGGVRGATGIGQRGAW